MQINFAYEQNILRYWYCDAFVSTLLMNKIEFNSITAIQRNTFFLLFSLRLFILLQNLTVRNENRIKLEYKKCWNCTYHPPCRVSVKPNRESRSTDTRIPMIPNPCGVITWPRITDTRLHNESIHKRTKEKEKKRFGKIPFVSNVIGKSDQ